MQAHECPRDTEQMQARLLQACLRHMRTAHASRHLRTVFLAWHAACKRQIAAVGPEQRIQKLEAEVAHWRRSVDGAREVIDEQQRKIGEQSLRIASLEKDVAALTHGERASALVRVVDEQTRAMSDLQLQLATMARAELGAREEHSRKLAQVSMHLAEQATRLAVAAKDRDVREQALAAARAASASALSSDADQTCIDLEEIEVLLQRTLAEKVQAEEQLVESKMMSAQLLAEQAVLRKALLKAQRTTHEVAQHAARCEERRLRGMPGSAALSPARGTRSPQSDPRPWGSRHTAGDGHASNSSLMMLPSSP